MAVIMSDVTQGNELFAKKLTRAIKRWPDTGAELALRVGISRQVLQHYMSGSTPKPAMVKRLADELGTSVDWLCDDSDERLDPVPAQDQKALRLEDVSELELVFEVIRRMRLAALDLHRRISKIEAAKETYTRTALQLWIDVWRSGLDHRPSDDETARMYEAADLVRQLDHLSGTFDLDMLSTCYHRQLPGYPEVQDSRRLTRTAIEDAFYKLGGECPGVDALHYYSDMVPWRGDTSDTTAVGLHNNALAILDGLIDKPEARGLKEIAEIKKDLKKHGLRK